MPAVVRALAMTPVKATRLRSVQSIRLGEDGVRENRRFFLIDEQGEMVNAKNLGVLQTIISAYSDDDRRLSLRFPDGRVLEDEVRPGEEVMTSFYSQPMPARLVEGEWSDAISDRTGVRLRLVEAGDAGAVDRGAEGAVTMISTASLQRLAEQAERTRVDGHRFRMLIEIDGVGAHEEDRWVGRRLAVGETIIAARGHVGRCVITSRHPETGVVDLHTLKILGSYRKQVETTEPVAIGIFGEVVRPGEVGVGDSVEPLID
jgi:MOSC domain-containing protein